MPLPAAAPAARPASEVSSLLLCLAGMALFSWLQFSTPAFNDPDSYYHTKVAWLISRGELLPFRWLPLTVLNADSYVDHHFLFHVLLAPLVSQSLLLGGKWAAAACAALALAAFLFVLPSTGLLPRLSAFALYVGASTGFLYRMSMVRAQSLSLMVLLLAWHAYRTRSYRTLASIAFIYVWLYNAFPLLLALTACFLAAEWILDRRLDLRAAAAVLAGMIAGMCINPFFPENAAFLAHHLVDKFRPQGFAVKVGGEWYPYTAGQLLQNAGLPLLCLAAAALLLLRFRRCSSGVLALHFLAWISLVMLLRSKRFIELFPPLAVLSLLWAAYESLQEASRRRFAAALLIAGVVVAPQTISTAAQEIAGAPPYERYQTAAAWLRTNSARGDIVWTSDWDDFPRLLHFNHHNAYIAGLDPYFFYAEHPELYRLWVQMTRGEAQLPLGPLARNCFGARFIFVDSGHRALRRQLAADKSVAEVFTAPEAQIYAVCPDQAECRAPTASSDCRADGGSGRP